MKLRFLALLPRRIRQPLECAWITFRGFRQRPDVFEFYGSFSWLAILLLKMIPRRRFIIIHHSNGLDPHVRAALGKRYPARSKLRKTLRVFFDWIQDRSFTMPDHLVCVSIFDRDFAVKFKYLPPHRISSIENRLSTEFLHRPLVLNRARVVGFVGAWLPRKGIEIIIRDFIRLLDENESLQALFIGTGSDLKMETEFPERLWPRIEIIPKVTERSELAKCYERISVFVLPSRFESFGLVTIEAMACGCAAVTSRTGFGTALVDGVDALLIPEGEFPSIVGQVQRLLDDDGLRRRIAAAGFTRVQTLSWDSAIIELEELFKRLLHERRETTCTN